ncbi:MAG: radical SAM protein [Pseudomonadota bacterium]
MTNLVLTSRCDLSCSYCFARPVFSKTGPPRDTPLDLFEQALDFLELSGQDQACLLGGEPTLHPDFPTLVHRAAGRGFRLLVFSNGRIPEESLKALADVSPDKMSLLLNLTAAGSENHDQAVARVLDRLGSRVGLGLNLSSPNFSFEAASRLIARHGLRPLIRVGLAHPGLTGENAFLPPRQYAKVGRKLLAAAADLAGQGISLELDCGFTPCMFPGGEGPGDLVDLGRRCNPLPDLLPDGTMIACFALAALGRLPFTAAKTAGEFRDLFFEKLSPYEALGVFPECRSCGFRLEGKCQGGCRATALRRLRRGPFTLEIKTGVSVVVERAPDPKAPPSLPPVRPQIAVPYIDQPLSFWIELAQRRGPEIKEVYFPLPGNIIGSGRPERPDRFLRDFLRDAPLPRSVLLNPVVLPRPVEDLAPVIIEALKKLQEECDLAGAVVANPALAVFIREALPDLPLTASTLMDIAAPNQALLLNGVCDALVPASGIMRDLEALKALRQAFSGRIRLLVNEGCLPRCLLRSQHFFEMANARDREPRSLCRDWLEQRPWLRLTGAFVLPQHLGLFDGCYDELKLAGRVSLQRPDDFRRTLDAYLDRTPLTPDRIGGGPAAPTVPLEIDDDFYARTLVCKRRCHACDICRDYYERKTS